MRRDEVDQLRAILTSDLTAEAMVVWTYLQHVIPQGAGQPHLDKAFGGTGVNWRDAVDILLELELVEQTDLARGGLVYKPKKPDVVKGKLSSTPTLTLDGAIEVLSERYQKWREDNGFRRWIPTPADEAKWESLLKWVRAHNVDFQAYLDFCHRLYEPIKAVHIPSPSHLAGPYAQSNWLNRDSSGPEVEGAAKRKAHAGSEYRPAKAIKRRLADLGIEVEDSARARWLDDMAQAVALDPSTPVPAKWQEAVALLAEDHRRAASS